MKSKLYLPAEWEPQSAVLLTWPHEETDWKGYLEEIDNTYAELAEAITRHEKLIIVTPAPKRVRPLLSIRLSDWQMERVAFHQCKTNDTWARDHGFITLMPCGEEDNAQPEFLDFRFNGWGDKFEASLDNCINRSLYDSGMLRGRYVDLNSFVLEGGSIETDGCGTVFTTSCCLLAPHRNQPLTRDRIEGRLREYLHADRVVWIDYGKLTGDDTDGHIDTLVRTAPGNTLLYIGCDNPADEQYEELKRMEEQLGGLRTMGGRPYHLLRLPMPDPLFFDGERLPATYANFLIINGAVIYPTYNQPENDERAASVLHEAFPDRELIAIDASIVVRQHGSLHCCSMQFPEAVLSAENKNAHTINSQTR